MDLTAFENRRAGEYRRLAEKMRQDALRAIVAAFDRNDRTLALYDLTVALMGILDDEGDEGLDREVSKAQAALKKIVAPTPYL